jgi:predicted  nucleic acid-binding Zn-ribbon protein
MEERDFKCLRCGAINKFPYKKGVMIERQCPACGSNSIRMVKEKDTSKEQKK